MVPRTVSLLAGVALVAACNVGTDESIHQNTQSIAAIAGQWEALGGDLSPDATFTLSRPSLAIDSMGRPILAFSSTDPMTYADTTTVSRWDGAAWVPLAEPLSGALSGGEVLQGQLNLPEDAPDHGGELVRL